MIDQQLLILHLTGRLDGTHDWPLSRCRIVQGKSPSRQLQDDRVEPS